MKTLISAAAIALLLASSGPSALAQGRLPGGPYPGYGYGPSRPPGFAVERRGDPRFDRRPWGPRYARRPFVVVAPQVPCPPPIRFGPPLGGLLRFVFRP